MTPLSMSTQWSPLNGHGHGHGHRKFENRDTDMDIDTKFFERHDTGVHRPLLRNMSMITMV